MQLLEGHRAIVTGGGSGIGAATCRRFAEHGAQVAVFDVVGDRAESVAAEISGVAYTVDVTDFDALDAAVHDAAARFDGISLLVQQRGWQQPAAAARVSRRRVAAHRDAQPLRRLLRHQGGRSDHARGGGGAIVSTASISGTRPRPGEAPYAAAKAAVAALTCSAALEYAPTIRVNAVSPGMIHTPMTDCC